MTPCTLLHETQNHTQDTKSKLMKQNVATHILKENQLLLSIPTVKFSLMHWNYYGADEINKNDYSS